MPNKKDSTIIKVTRNGQQVYEGPDRRFFDSDWKSKFDLSLGDLIKAIPIILACGMVYANNESFKKEQLEVNQQLVSSNTQNAQAIGGIKEVLWNLNNYLSSTTGKQFRDGRPY